MIDVVNGQQSQLCRTKSSVSSFTSFLCWTHARYTLKRWSSSASRIRSSRRTSRSSSNSSGTTSGGPWSSSSPPIWAASSGQSLARRRGRNGRRRRRPRRVSSPPTPRTSSTMSRRSVSGHCPARDSSLRRYSKSSARLLHGCPSPKTRPSLCSRRRAPADSTSPTGSVQTKPSRCTRGGRSAGQRTDSGFLVVFRAVDWETGEKSEFQPTDHREDIGTPLDVRKGPQTRRGPVPLRLRQNRGCQVGSSQERQLWVAEISGGGPFQH